MALYNDLGRGLFKRAVPPVVQDRGYYTPEPFITYDGPVSPLTREYSFSDPGVMYDVLYGAYSEANMIQLFYAIPEIAAPVLQIANRIAAATWLLKKYSNDEVDYKNNQFNRLFSKPNPLQDINMMISQMIVYEILLGKSYTYVNIPTAFKNFDFNSINTWGNLPPHQTYVDKYPNVDVYSATKIEDIVRRYVTASDSWSSFDKEFTPDRVLPYVNMSIYQGNDMCMAKSQLAGAEAAITNLILVYAARKAIYLKRGALGFLVSRKSDDAGYVSLTPDEKKEALNDFYGSYGLTAGKSPVGITSLPIDFVRTAMSIEELQPFEETVHDAAGIYAVLDVPPHLIPRKDSSTYANAEADMIEFYQGNICLRASAKAKAWTSFFRFDQVGDGRIRRYIDATFPNVKYLQTNKKEESVVNKTNGDTYLIRFQNGVGTLNQWRVANGEEKVTLPLYDKTTIEMTPEELELVKTALNLKVNAASQTEGSQAEEQGNREA